MRPIETAASEQLHFAIFDARLHAIAIELELVQPVFTGGRKLRCGGELRGNELGQRLGLCAFRDGDAALLSDLYSFLPRASRLGTLVGGEAGARIPYVIGGAADGIEVAMRDDTVGRFIDDGGRVGGCARIRRAP